MSILRRSLLAVGLIAAVSCTEDGTPVSPRAEDTPRLNPAPGNVMQMLTCEVDVLADTFACAQAEPSTGDARGALISGQASPAYLQLAKSNNFFDGTDHTFDITIKNLMTRQVLGTVDGTTAHPAGMRVFFADPNSALPSPRVTQKINPADSAWVSVVTPDTGAFEGSLHIQRPYFQYDPDVLLPGETSAPETWHFQLHNAAAYTITVWVATEVLYPKGWLDVVPATPVLEVGGIDTLTAQVRNSFDRLHLESNVIWTSSDPMVVAVTEILSPAPPTSRDTLAQITAVAEGSAWIKAVSSQEPTHRRDSVLVTVNNVPAVQLDSIDAPARVRVRISAERLRNGLAEGDSVVPVQVINTANGLATVDAQRSLSYVSKGGFVGTDTVPVDVTDGTWTVADTLLVKVAASNYWFVQPGATGDGSNARPLASLAEAVDSAGTGDTIFALRSGSTELVGAATLEGDQALIGHGVPASFFLRAEGLNEPSGVDTIFQGQSLGSPLANTGAAPLTLGANNTLRGVNVSSAGAAAIHGAGFGTLAVSDVIVQAGGPSLSLLNGSVVGSFLGLHSLNSDSTGITLVNVGGTAAATAGSISGPASTAFLVNGGNVSLGFPGDISQGTSHPLVSVTGHTGALTFSGALLATGGTGVQFSNADGTYEFTGTTTLNGGDAAVDVTSGSSGTITFGPGSTITNPSGNVFRIEASAPAFTYAGSFSKSSAGVGVLIQNNTGGSATFSGASKVLSTGTSHAVSILTDQSNVSFTGGGLAITTAGGRGFYAQDADSIVVTGAGNTVATTGATAVYLQNARSGPGGISFQSVSGSGALNAIVLNSLPGAGFQVTGTGSPGSGGTLSAPNVAVVISSADSTRLRRMVVTARVAFSAASFGALRVDSSSVSSSAGKALGLATGRLYVSDVAVSSIGGAALDANGVTLNGTLSSLSATTAAGSGVLLTNALGSLTANAGSIVANSGAAAAIAVAGATNAGLAYAGNVTQNANAALLSVSGGHTGALTFHTGTLTAANGSGLQFNNADGTYAFSGTTALSNTVGGADAGIDVISGSGGTFAFASTTTVTNPSAEAVRIASSGPAFTYGGTITKTNGSTGITVTGSTGTMVFNSIGGTARTIASGGTHPAVNLTSNTGGTISFGGGNLAVSSDDGNAFNATGGGTVNVTGLTNTLSSTGGIALNVSGTSIGASGMTWRSINANGGASGIALNNVGLGALNVVGNGGVCTLATPTCSGGTIQNTTGDAVSLNAVTRVRLDRVRVLNSAGHGIAGTATSGLTLANSLVHGAGDADDEAGLFFATPSASNLTGTDSIIGSVVHAPSDVGAYVHNYGGTLNLVVQGSTFTGTDLSTAGVVTGDDLFRLVTDRAASSATITAGFTGNTFDQSENHGLAGVAQSSTGSGGGTLNLTVDGNTFNGDNGGASCSSGCNENGINVWGQHGAVVRFTIQNNDVQNQRNQGVIVRADNTASVQGTVQNNTIGGATSRSASYLAQGILVANDDDSDLVVRVHNNTVGSAFWQGIWANASDAGSGSPNMDVTLTSNSTRTPADDGGTYLPSIDVQGTAAAEVCARVQGNTAQAGASGAGSVDLLQLDMATFAIEGLPSATNDASSYVEGQNPASATPVYAFAAGAGSTFTGATCRTPAATPTP